NADQIKEMVKGIQEQVMNVLRDITSIGEVIRGEVEKAKKTATDLDTIESDMRVVAQGVNNVKEQAGQSLTKVEEASKGVEQIATAAQEASAAAEEAATASRQQAEGMRELSQAIEEIAALADELQQG
ncbi:MAG: methyl-accepting chemotaxis protein, partial [Moorellaceae bacterium]